ncbi:MAG: CAP domain-containing protein [Defluviitaleaceae bacterium]|nr:CAP domain-containing protein [Defluviitaleaceae bacterium]
MEVLLVCACFLFSGIETDLVFEINREREMQGVEALAFNWELARIARYRSEEMAELGFFGHESRIYGEPDEMLLRFGVVFSAAGVNIAKGQDSAREVVNAWLSSPAHKENLLNENFTSAGVGVTFDDGIPFWTLILISS